ncbi:M48 family metalloprotease [Sphingomonas sp. SUN039]|uniref:M48 family metalloprotease n=1 Tax=Sphingomonas sp. SUN039 TaxID=2937787 RepID=UPI002164D6AF|nr:M48 family metalloprotease [Sphingomonas sp. SUN039]UVO55653.1 M48 family metalloprotease [Sphingomonas sp. SUN039]
MRGRDLPRTALAACVVLALATPAQAQFGGIGNLIKGVKNAQKLSESFRKISEAEEIKIGGDLAGIILGVAPLIKDGPKQQYINRLGRWLALHSDRPDLPWKFGIVETADVNAFSMPGGYVLITRGMFDKMRSESELAGVLAHEIAHVAHKDHLAALQGSLRNSALTGFSEYATGSGGLGALVKTAIINAGKDMFTRGLNKDDEFDADRTGVVIAARAGFSPFGLPGVLQTLSAAGDGKGYALMTKTHPLPVERIERLDKAMGTRMDALALADVPLPSFTVAPPPSAPKAAPAGPRKPKRKS